MNCNSPDVEDLQKRVVKLEQQNRRFKQFGVGILAIAAVILVMGQAPSKKTVEANEFILRDSGGNVRIKLSMEDHGVGDTPKMAFLDAKGTPNLELEGSVRGLFGGTVGIDDEQGRRVGTWFANFAGGAFWISTGKTNVKGGVSLTPDSVTVTDDAGFEAVVGTEDLMTPTTGETHKTSAASLVLLDKNKTVIWNAP
jgi:hypothetical protein